MNSSLLSAEREMEVFAELNNFIQNHNASASTRLMLCQHFRLPANEVMKYLAFRKFDYKPVTGFQTLTTLSKPMMISGVQGDNVTAGGLAYQRYDKIYDGDKLIVNLSNTFVKRIFFICSVTDYTFKSLIRAIDNLSLINEDVPSEMIIICESWNCSHPRPHYIELLSEMKYELPKALSHPNVHLE